MKTLSLSEPTPVDAGGVSLDFSPDHALPSRPHGENRLLLPLVEGAEYHPLKGGEQFLITYPQAEPATRDRFNTRDWWQYRRLAATSFFGGMDESAFITPVDESVVMAFRIAGEDGFFDILVPNTIKYLRECFPGQPVYRQGDIWSFKLPYSWNDLASSKTVLIERGGLTRKEWKRKKSLQRQTASKFNAPADDNLAISVLGTNHVLTGWLIQTSLKMDACYLHDVFIGQGVLTAPDHAPVMLLDGPHVFERTPHTLAALSPSLNWE